MFFLFYFQIIFCDPEITNAIIKVINNKAAFIPDQKEVLKKFSYPVYKENFGKILEDTLMSDL